MILSLLIDIYNQKFILIYRNLKSMEKNEILSTFDYHANKLRTYFQKFKDAHKFQYPKVNYDYCVVLEKLLTSEQQTAMFTKMKETFVPTADYGVTSVRIILLKLKLIVIIIIRLTT